ncbi:MAG: hypothetical protein ACJAV5_001602 [Vicingaceae bacterium]|jgi:hypothetical protein
MKYSSFSIALLFSTLLLTLNSCDNNETFPEESTDPNNPVITLKGTNSFVFDSFAPLANKPTTIYYHIPTGVTENSRIVVVFHGAARDALESRDALIANADRNQQILIVPEFSSQNFPGGDGYNLGNVFDDGDNPTAATLNDEGEWAFSLVEPLFDFVKRATANASSSYHVFGFSAGGQFAHRFVFFKPNARFDKVVAASSGWYTMPDDQIDFPYGIKESPILASSLPAIFGKQLTVLIGSADNDPNAGGLRTNSIVDVQGDNRLARANYFYNQSNSISTGIGAAYNWQFVSLPNVSHDFSVTGNYAFNTIFIN